MAIHLKFILLFLSLLAGNVYGGTKITYLPNGGVEVVVSNSLASVYDYLEINGVLYTGSRIIISEPGIHFLDFYKSIGPSNDFDFELSVWQQNVFVPTSFPQEARQLAEKYQPIISFHSSEEYFPVSLPRLLGTEQGFDNPDPSLRISSGCTNLLCVNSELTNISLGVEAQQELALNGHLYNFIDMPDKDVSCDSFNTACNPHFYRDTSVENIANSTVYWTASSNQSFLDISYYFFYRFDPKDGNSSEPGAASHALDRESVTIRFQRNNEDYEPHSIVYAGHLPDQRMDFKGCDEQRQCQNEGNTLLSWKDGKTSLLWSNALKLGDNPVLYIAKGSHAVFPTYGHYTVVNLVAGSVGTDIVLALDEPASSIDTEKFIFPDNLNFVGNDFSTYEIEELDFSIFNFLAFSGPWVEVKIISNAEFPPFTDRLPTATWLIDNNFVFNDCFTISTNDCEQVVDHLKYVRGLAETENMTVKVVLDTDEEVEQFNVKFYVNGEVARVFDTGTSSDVNFTFKHNRSNIYSLGITSPTLLDEFECDISELSFDGLLPSGGHNVECLISPIIDSDNDGLTDIYEVENGLNPRSADSDDDGIVDFVEIGTVLSSPINLNNDNLIDALDPCFPSSANDACRELAVIIKVSPLFVSSSDGNALFIIEGTTLPLAMVAQLNGMSCVVQGQRTAELQQFLCPISSSSGRDASLIFNTRINGSVVPNSPYEIEVINNPVELSVPTNITARIVGDNNIELNWDEVDGADGYFVYVQPNRNILIGSSDLAIFPIPSNTSSFLFTNTTPGQTYYFAVTSASEDGSNESELSSQVQLFIPNPDLEPEIPNPPNGLSALAGIDSISINWDSVVGASEYKLYFSNSRNTLLGEAGIVRSISTGLSTTYEFETNTTGKFYFAVTSIVDGLESELSNIVDASLIVSEPSSPTNISASGKADRIIVNWDETADADEYMVYVSEDPAFGINDAGVINYSVPEFLFFAITNDLEVGTEYHIGVTSVRDGLESRLSEKVSAMLLEPIQPEPVVTAFSPNTATVGEEVTFTLVGTDLPPTISVSLEGTANCVINSKSEAQVIVTCVPQLAGAKELFVADVPNGDAIEGPSRNILVSEEVQLTLLNPPENIVAIANNGRLAVTWTNVENAETYNVYVSDQIIRSTGVAGVSQYVDENQPLVIPDLERNRIYYIAVTAQNGNVESSISESVEVVLFRENDISVFDRGFTGTDNFEMDSDGLRSVFTGTVLDDTINNNSDSRRIGVYLFDSATSTVVPIVETTDITIAQELKISGNGDYVIFTHSSLQVPGALANTVGNRNQLYFYRILDGAIFNIETAGSPRDISISYDGRLIAFHQSGQVPTTVVRFSNGNFNTVFEADPFFRLLSDNRTVFVSPIKISGGGQYMLFQGRKMPDDNFEDLIPVVIRADIESGEVVEIGDGYSYDISGDGGQIIAGMEGEILIYDLDADTTERVQDFRFQQGIVNSLSLGRLHETSSITDEGRFILLSGGFIDVRDPISEKSRQLYDRTISRFVESEYNIDKISGSGELVLGNGFAPNDRGSVNPYAFIALRPE